MGTWKTLNEEAIRAESTRFNTSTQQWEDMPSHLTAEQKNKPPLIIS